MVGKSGILPVEEVVDTVEVVRGLLGPLDPLKLSSQ